MYLMGALAAATACGSPTEMTLSIDTTVGIPCSIDRIRIRGMGSESSTYERDITDVRLPLVVTLADETSNAAFDLEVIGLKGDVEVLRAAGPLRFGSTSRTEVVLEPSCTPDAPCTLAAPTTQVTSRFECGKTRYAQSTAVESFRDACVVPGANTGMVLLGGKRGAEKLGLSDEALANFNFRFYGQPVRQIWAHEDGYISFSADNPDEANNLDPGALDRDILRIGVPPPPQSVMVFWDQLTLTGGVCYALEGTPGNQKLRVTWAKTCQTQACTNDRLNFTIVLDERTQRVSLTYGEMIAVNTSRAQGGSATVGIVNEANGCPVADCNGETNYCSDGVTPCGYSQAFSNTPQSPRVPDIQFEPLTDGE
jgi:hypothetical protein